MVLYHRCIQPLDPLRWLDLLKPIGIQQLGATVTRYHCCTIIFSFKINPILNRWHERWKQLIVVTIRSTQKIYFGFYFFLADSCVLDGLKKIGMILLNNVSHNERFCCWYPYTFVICVFGICDVTIQ